jgi:crossover junction endodeoxyribonuclease RusA
MNATHGPTEPKSPLNDTDWFELGDAKGRALDHGYEFVLCDVTSQAKVYKQKLRDLLRLKMALSPQDGAFEVMIVIDLNPNFPAIDLDNVAKAVLDGIKGHVFHDDAQVMRLVVEKHWAETERVIVTVWARR